MARLEPRQTSILPGTGRIGAPNVHTPCRWEQADRVARPLRHPTVHQRLVTDAGAPVRSACVPDPRSGTQRRGARRSDRTVTVPGNTTAGRPPHRPAGHHLEATGGPRPSPRPRVRGNGVPGCGARSPLGRMRRSPGRADRLRPVDHHRCRTSDTRCRWTIRYRATQVGGRPKNAGRSGGTHRPSHTTP